MDPQPEAVSLGLRSTESEYLTRMTALVEADAALFWRLGTFSILIYDARRRQCFADVEYENLTKLRYCGICFEKLMKLHKYENSKIPKYQSTKIPKYEYRH